jgi:anti-sigma factor RsiW
MECREVRKKLKEYASDVIYDEEILQEMELHIETCQVCKRELLLWQDVVAKQKENSKLASYLDGDFRTRVKYRMAKIESDRNMPPAARRIMALQKAFRSVTGRLVFQLVLLLIGVLYFLLVMRKGANLFSVFFIVLGFGTLIFLLFQKKKK